MAHRVKVTNTSDAAVPFIHSKKGGRRFEWENRKPGLLQPGMSLVGEAATIDHRHAEASISLTMGEESFEFTLTTDLMVEVACEFPDGKSFVDKLMEEQESEITSRLNPVATHSWPPQAGLPPLDAAKFLCMRCSCSMENAQRGERCSIPS